MRSPSMPRPMRLPVARPSDRVLALLALSAATALWGTSFVAAKVVLDAVPPVTLAVLRFAIGLAVLLPLTRAAGVRPARGRVPALLGLTGVALLFLCQNVGLERTSAANATLIMNGAYPVLTAALAAAFLRERLTGRLALGIPISLVGVAATVVGGSGTGLDVSVVGDLLILAGTLCAALYAVIGRRAFAGTGADLLANLSGSTLYGTLFLLPIAAFEVQSVGVPSPAPGDWLLIAYLGAGCSGLTYLLWAYGLRHLGAGEGATVCNLEIAVGVVAASILLGEPLAAVQLAGGALILAGAWVAAGRAAPRAAVDAAGTTGHAAMPAATVVGAPVGAR